MSKKVVFSLDDFSLMNNDFELLLKLKEHYPQLKVSMFMIPFHAEFEISSAHIFRDGALKTLHDNLDWIQIIPHGLTHMDREFEKADKEAMRLTMRAIDKLWTMQGIPYVKGFKAPQWLWNKDVVEVLDKEGWFGSVDRNQPNMLKTKKFYEYNWSISEPFIYSEADVLKLHGHINPEMDNDFDKCFLQLMSLPADTEFFYVTDFLENREDRND